jgi:hypothetical protein
MVATATELTKEQWDACMVLMDDVRAEIVEAQKTLAASVPQTQALTLAIDATCATLLRRLDEPVVPGLQGALDEILQVMRAERQRPRLNWKRLAGLGGALVLLSGFAGWYVAYTPRLVRQQATLMQHINAVLLERQSALPADLKAKLGAVYTQQGFPTLEQQGRKP